MKQPTGKRVRAMKKIERRLQRASTAYSIAVTPGQITVAQNEGIKAASAYENLKRAMQ